MSSESDKVAFENSVEPYESSVLFKDKAWTYITDSTSNGGNFTGQLQFDLNTLSSQSQWVNLSQSYIQFPVKVSIKNTSGSSQTPATVSALATALKNGYHQFVDSVQIVLDGSTVQTSQIFENIATNYKILSEWSHDEYAKYGPSLGISLDTYTSSLNNATIAGLIPQYKGVDLTGANNTALVSRQYSQNVDVTATFASSSILGQQAKIIGKSQVQASASAVASQADAYVQFVLATIRLKDISPVLSGLPMMRNLKGFIYVNYNSATTTLTTNASGAYTANIPTSNIYGRCNPVLLTSGFTPAAGVANTWQLTCEISGVQSANLTSAQPTISYARLVAPYYVANPAIDSALSMKKTFRYLERNVTTFNLTAGQNFTVTLSPGISNPKRVLLFPYFTGGTGALANLISNPLNSPFDTCPSTTSPFSALKDIQILVGNVPMFQNPVQQDYDLFLQEIAQQGLDGGLNSQANSGLLSQQDYDTLYRYVTCDVGRRLESEDGSSKSVIVQCTNATQANMTVIAMIFYEKEITVDTSMGKVSQGRS